MRILITGSRSWTDAPKIAAVLQGYHYAYAFDAPGANLTLVSGACPDGADAICEHVASVLGWTIERHPADWSRHGRRAGYVRNAEMVALGADVCLAFISECTSPRCARPRPHQSHGARHTADLAERHGIPVQRFAP